MALRLVPPVGVQQADGEVVALGKNPGIAVRGQVEIETRGLAEAGEILWAYVHFPFQRRYKMGQLLPAAGAGHDAAHAVGTDDPLGAQ